MTPSEDIISMARESWELAIRAKERLARCPSDDMREQILETAQANGFVSVWMTVFADEATIHDALRARLGEKT